jgi:hypothetical protein
MINSEIKNMLHREKYRKGAMDGSKIKLIYSYGSVAAAALPFKVCYSVEGLLNFFKYE